MKSRMSTVCDTVRHFFNNLRPTYFLEQIQQEVREKDRGKLQKETIAIESVVDEYLKSYIRRYSKGLNEFSEVYETSTQFKKDLKQHVTNWIFKNCAYVNRCNVFISIDMDPGFYVKQQVLVCLYRVNNKLKTDEAILYRVIQITRDGVDVIHTKSPVG